MTTYVHMHKIIYLYKEENNGGKEVEIPVVVNFVFMPRMFAKESEDNFDEVEISGFESITGESLEPDLLSLANAWADDPDNLSDLLYYARNY